MAQQTGSDVVLTPQKGESEVKKKYFKKDKKDAKKKKAPKNVKKIVKAKKQARRIRVTVSKELSDVEPGTHDVSVTSVAVGPEVAHIELAPFIAEPEALTEIAVEEQEPAPDVEVHA